MITTHLLDKQPEKDGAPVFDAPWQAKAFVMAVQLHHKGCFEWSEWADKLSANIKKFEETKEIRNSDDYYGLWLTTLEDICETVEPTN